MRQWECGNGVCVRLEPAGGWLRAMGRRAGEAAGGGSVLMRPAATPRRRSDASIACTVPGGTLPATVPVCVRFEQRGCVRGGLSFQYMPNPVITAISPHRSHVR